MSARTSVVVLLVAVLACEPSAVPLQPVDDPLESLRLPEAGAPGQYRITFPHFAAGSDELTVAASNAFTVQPTGVSEAK